MCPEPTGFVTIGVMTRLLLCRHGATDWNLAGRYQGQSDIPLNEVGLAQAETLADDLQQEPITAIYSSTLSRAIRTAQIVAERHDLDVLQDARFNEINQGVWEGLTVEEIVLDYPDDYRVWSERPLETRPPGGESIAEVQERVLQAMWDVHREHTNGLVVIVAHKVSLAVIHSAATGEPLQEELKHLPANAAVARCVWSDALDIARILDPLTR